MIEAFQVKVTQPKQEEIIHFLTGYWKNDVWDIADPFFNELRPEKWLGGHKRIDFSTLPVPIRDEIKFMFATRLQCQEIRLTSVITYSTTVKKLGKFLNLYYPNISSIVDIPYEKSVVQWRTYLVELGIKINKLYEAIFNQFHSFFVNYYDTREETEKNIWDIREIPGTRITETQSDYLLNFIEIPLSYRNLTKRYIKFRLINVSQAQARRDLMSLRLFLKYINKQYPAWKDLNSLTRKDMEGYLAWYRQYTQGWKDSQYNYIISLGLFLEYIQRAEYPEAPEKPSVMLLFNEDYHAFKPTKKSEDDIKYISEGVLQQLEENLEHLTPAEYIPIVILLRASGWRISDILNLKYNTCLDRTSQGWYLSGDIPKTQVLNHHVPITDEVAAVVQAVAEEVKDKSTKENNPKKLLFVRFDGKRKGRCPESRAVQNALNRLAQRQNIVDDQGNIFHFGNHAFRHTKGVELINNGMSLLHVQKWMAHASPEMTLRYAKILDTSMRKSWEEATKQGLFRVDASGKPTKIDVTDIQNEDLVEWEYIRSNLDAVRMPLGYCMKPKKQECHTQLNPCLTCRNLCTTPDFIPQYELEIQETKAMIERGNAQGRSIWVEKNQTLLERYETILAVLKEGKTHHKAGKKGREYIGEERNSAK